MLVHVILYSVTVLLVLAGMGMLHRAAFADRSRGRPRCPRCWYDMTGSRGFVCPECGHDARRQRNLHRTRRHGGRVMLGALLVVSGLSLGAVPTVQEQGWSALIPTTGLMLVLPWTDNEWVFEEVDARVTASRPKWFVRRGREHDVTAMTKFYARRCAALVDSRRKEDLRRRAVQMLFDLSVRDGQVERVLLKAARDQNPTIRWEAISALSQMAANGALTDPQGCARTVSLRLKDSTLSVSIRAARFFRFLDPVVQDILPDLIAALDDERVEVRIEACLSLALYGDRAGEAVPRLIALFDDPSRRMATVAINICGRIGFPAAASVQRLAEIALLNDARSDASLTALTRLGAAAVEAIPTLRAILEDAGQENRRRVAAAAALLAINPYEQSILDSIEAVAREDDENLCALIARQITRVRANEPQQVRIVMGMLSSESARVRQEANLALGRLAPLRPDEIALLARWADDPHFIGREEAQSALGRASEEPDVTELPPDDDDPDADDPQESESETRDRAGRGGRRSG